MRDCHQGINISTYPYIICFRLVNLSIPLRFFLRQRQFTRDRFGPFDLYTHIILSITLPYALYLFSCLTYQEVYAGLERLPGCSQYARIQ